MTGILIAIVVLLAILALVQIVKVFEITSSIRGHKDNDVNEKDNQIQGVLLMVFMVVFVVGSIWMTIAWRDVLLPKAASSQGEATDTLMWVSMAIIGFVFLVTQPILFYFAYKYRGVKGRKAEYVAHNNRLELIWTTVPAVALAVLIIYGITTWSNIMNPKFDEEPLVVEIYARQFDWHVRYSGGDQTLGYANVRFVQGANIMGVDPDDPDGLDDIVVKQLHLPVGKPVTFKFRSQDVIHSAYMPHFRAQMNCVPGTVTNFSITPTITSKEMRDRADVQKREADINAIREAKGEDLYEFEYVLLCNKICGAAHYNMKLPIVVETQEEFEAWLSEQKTLAETL